MTIKDLAKLTGYSVGTVSRVLNDQPNVSSKARKVISEAAEQCAFQLNANAKMLKQQQANSILLVVKGMATELLTSLVERITTLLADTDYQLDLDFIDEDADEVRRAVKLCAEKKPKGILFLGGNPEHFVQSFHGISVPCVLVTNSARELQIPNLSSVTTDDRHAAAAAIDTLVGLGHRHIAIIGGDRERSHISRLRYEGCREALARAGIPYCDETDYCAARYSYSEGYRAARRLLEQKPDMTAIFAMADVMAIGAMRALTDCGKRVPEDVSVMGFDGLTVGEYLRPKLATICQCRQELALRSVEILRGCMEQGAPARHVTVPYTVNCNESAHALE